MLQHKSMVWHVDRMVRWSEDLASRGGKKKGNGIVGVDPTVGTPRMEVRKFGRSYSHLLEMMLEHAQMEEKILFPILDVDDPGMLYPFALLHVAPEQIYFYLFIYFEFSFFLIILKMELFLGSHLIIYFAFFEQLLKVIKF